MYSSLCKAELPLLGHHSLDNVRQKKISNEETGKTEALHIETSTKFQPDIPSLEKAASGTIQAANRDKHSKAEVKHNTIVLEFPAACYKEFTETQEQPKTYQTQPPNASQHNPVAANITGCLDVLKQDPNYELTNQSQMGQNRQESLSRTCETITIQHCNRVWYGISRQDDKSDQPVPLHFRPSR